RGIESSRVIASEAKQSMPQRRDRMDCFRLRSLSYGGSVPTIDADDLGKMVGTARSAPLPTLRRLVTVDRWRYADARNSRAAATMLTSAGRTSSHLRVFNPQSGLIQIWASDSRLRASLSRAVISPISG